MVDDLAPGRFQRIEDGFWHLMKEEMLQAAVAIHRRVNKYEAERDNAYQQQWVEVLRRLVGELDQLLHQLAAQFGRAIALLLISTSS